MITLKDLTLPEGLRSLEDLVLLNYRLTNLTLPKGLVSLYWLSIADVSDTPMTSLKLPEDFGKNENGIQMSLMPSIERLSMHKNMKEFRLFRYDGGGEFDFPPARRLIRNRSSDNDGVYRIESRPPLLVEVYGFQPTFTITRKAGGVEIGWEAGTLQRSLLIDGPWRDVESGGTERRIFLRPSHPYEFFRVKPVSE